MNKNFFLFFLLVLGLVIYSCQDDEENLPNLFEPTITEISPLEGAVGTEVLIVGEKFSIVKDQNLVRFGDATASIVESSPDSIKVIVPRGAETGTITLRIRNDPDLDSTNVAESPQEFTVLTARITGISPEKGVAGDEMEIEGVFLPASDPEFKVKIDTVTVLQILSKTDSLVKVILPENVQPGLVSIIAFEDTIVGPAFSVLPQLLGVTPASAPGGNEIELEGRNFGTNAELVSVTFSGFAAQVTLLRDTLIRTIVPETLATGTYEITVTVDDETTDPVEFSVTPADAPVIEGISPESGVVGDQVILSGSNFATDPDNTQLTFAGVGGIPVVATIINITDNQITATVPAGAISGQVILTIGPFEALGPAFTLSPDIMDFNPKRAWSGSTVTLTGSNFADLENNTVTVQFPLRVGGGFATAQEVEVNSSLDEMQVRIPPETGTGRIKLTINGIETESSQNMTILQPKIDDISPNWAPVGSLITLTGSNFSEIAEEDSVIFTLEDGSRINVVAETATRTQLTVRIPAGAGEDFLRIKVLDSEIRKGPWFRTGDPPASLFLYRGSGINGQGRGLLRLSFRALQPKDGITEVDEDIILPYTDALGQIRVLNVDPIEEKLYMMRNNAIFRVDFDGENLETIFDNNNTPGINFRNLTSMTLDPVNKFLYITTGGNDQNVGTNGVIMKADLNTNTISILYSINNGFFASNSGANPSQVLGITLKGNDLYWGQLDEDEISLPTTGGGVYEIVKGTGNGATPEVIYTASEIFAAGDFQNAIDANPEVTVATIGIIPVSEVVVDPGTNEIYTSTIFPVDLGNSGVFARSRVYSGSTTGAQLDMISDDNLVSTNREIFNFKLDSETGIIYGIMRPTAGDLQQDDDFIFRMDKDGSNFEILYTTPKFKLTQTIVIDPRGT